MYGMPLWATASPRTAGTVPGHETRRMQEPMWKHMAPVRRSAHLMLSGDRFLAHCRDSQGP